MPRGRSAAPAFSTGALATIRELRDRIEATKRDLREQRATAVASIAEIDQALAELGGTAPANDTPPPVRQPKVRRVEREQEAAPPSSSDKILDELKALAPWLPGLRAHQRKIVGLRLSGKSSTQIAADLGSTVKDVANAIYAGRVRLRELKSRGAPKPATAPDSDEEPEPAAEPKADAVSAAVFRLETELQRRRGSAQRRDGSPPSAAESNENEAARPEIADSQGYVGPLRTPLEEEKQEEAAAGAAVPLADLPALVAGAPRMAPGVPTWILDRLLPAWWTCYQGTVVEGCHPDVVAYLNATTASEVSRKAQAAEKEIKRLMAWEAAREADGLPLTEEDRLGHAIAPPDPLLAALGIK